MSRERGRRKLMLRLPDIRHHLEKMSGETLDEMFEVYDLAVDALDRFRRQGASEEKLVIEYEQICREIEQEILLYCTAR